MTNLNSDQIFSKLNNETALVQWQEVELFFARGQMLQVEPSQDLVAVATSIAQDNKSQIEQLMQTGQLAQATAAWVKAHCVSDTQLWAVVVSPYLLVQLKNTDSST